MRLALRWTPDAVQDLARLRAFIGSRNSAAAARAAGRILQAAAMLRERPELGRAVEGEDWRELVVPAGRGAYVLRYRMDDDAVVIARAWHTREHR
ncbi:MAG: type II toxin-antitoxin system RelE/ParE family toxin [Anaeromyxobacteraceae bacterium]